MLFRFLFYPYFNQNHPCERVVCSAAISLPYWPALKGTEKSANCTTIPATLKGYSFSFFFYFLSSERITNILPLRFGLQRYPLVIDYEYNFQSLFYFYLLYPHKILYTKIFYFHIYTLS